jgi:hypothetical protein
MTVIYMDADIRIAEPTNRWQRADWAAWLDGRPVGGPADGPRNPVLWSQA